MKKQFQKKFATTLTDRKKVEERMLFVASHCEEDVLKKLGTTQNGLTDTLVEESRENYGSNVIAQNEKESLFKKVCDAFVNPFTAILCVLALVSVITDVILAAPGEKNYVTILIITTMVMVSGALRFVQETRSGNAAKKLSKMICTTACVERIERGKEERSLEEIVVGDMIYLSAGDMIPADVRILSAKDLFVSQATLTGESEPVEKQGSVCLHSEVLTEIQNLAFLGSTVISGSAKAVVVAVGNDTLFGGISKELSTKPEKTSFEKGVNAVSWVLIRFMLVMVPIVLFLNGFTKGDWLQALLFAISVAVGLTPEMLPMIVTTGLAKGAVAM